MKVGIALVVGVIGRRASFRDMERQIHIEGKAIPYTIRRSSRAKRMSLSVRSDGAVILTLPQRVAVRLVKKFLHTHTDWIVKRVQKFSERDIHPDIANKSREHYLQHKERARSLLIKRVEFFAQEFGFEYGDIRIKNHTSRWGSCSAKGNLNFNYRIMFLPQELQDYIIVHELCHLREMNHSPKFWAHVGSIIPDYQSMKKKLKMVGL